MSFNNCQSIFMYCKKLSMVSPLKNCMKCQILATFIICTKLIFVRFASHLLIFFGTFRSIIQSSIYPKSEVSHQHLVEQLSKERNFKRMFLKQGTIITNGEFSILITAVTTYDQTCFKKSSQGRIY
jgi:hypothetical protein